MEKLFVETERPNDRHSGPRPGSVAPMRRSFASALASLAFSTGCATVTPTANLAVPGDFPKSAATLAVIVDRAFSDSEFRGTYPRKVSYPITVRVGHSSTELLRQILPRIFEQ